jgi:hypothetical protein
MSRVRGGRVLEVLVRACRLESRHERCNEKVSRCRIQPTKFCKINCLGISSLVRRAITSIFCRRRVAKVTKQVMHQNP